jgi:hypothetical protein
LDYAARAGRDMAGAEEFEAKPLRELQGERAELVERLLLHLAATVAHNRSSQFSPDRREQLVQQLQHIYFEWCRCGAIPDCCNDRDLQELLGTLAAIDLAIRREEERRSPWAPTRD